MSAAARNELQIFFFSRVFSNRKKATTFFFFFSRHCFARGPFGRDLRPSFPPGHDTRQQGERTHQFSTLGVPFTSHKEARRRPRPESIDLEREVRYPLLSWDKRGVRNVKHGDPPPVGWLRRLVGDVSLLIFISSALFSIFPQKNKKAAGGDK